MNSKELLERADQRIAEADKIKLAKQNIEDLERLLKVAQDDTYQLRYCGEFDLPLKQSLDIHSYEDLKGIIRGAFMRYLSMQTVKLEQLLGVTPKVINPEFEPAIRDTVNPPEDTTVPVISMCADTAVPIPGEDRSAGILQEETRQTKILQEDKSLDKYPARKKGRQIVLKV